MHQVKQSPIHDGTEHQLWLAGRSLPSATATVKRELRGWTASNRVWEMTVNWNALGDVPADLALSFAEGLRALCEVAQADFASRRAADRAGE